MEIKNINVRKNYNGYLVDIKNKKIIDVSVSESGFGYNKNVEDAFEHEHFGSYAILLRPERRILIDEGARLLFSKKKDAIEELERWSIILKKED